MRMTDLPTDFSVTMPDERGHFGPYGGVFVAETLIRALDELKSEYARYREDPGFRAAVMLQQQAGIAATDLVADGLRDDFWRIAAIAALLAAVVSLVTTALIRWLGTPGVALSALFIMLFSLPATGGAVGPEFVPDFYRAVAPALPSHAALLALKGSVYFGDRGIAGPLAILGAWAAGALLAQVAAHRVRPAPAPPRTGSPLEHLMSPG